jgi:hypothetical protein
MLLRYFLKPLLIFGLVGFSAGVSSSQTPKGTDVFSNVEVCVQNARNRFKSEPVKETLDAIRHHLEDIKVRWQNTGSKPLDKEYVASLNSYCGLLSQALKPNASNEEINETLSFIKVDLRYKKTASLLPGNATEGITTSINVTVETVSNGVEVSGYVVKCNPAILGRSVPSRFPFGSESPTSQSLPPGAYVLWVEHTDGAFVASREFNVGDKNSTEIRISVN